MDYCGYILSSQEDKSVSILPLTEKVKAVSEYPTPTTRTEVRRFLGMINQIAGWVPQLSMNTQRLQELTSESIIFHWLDIHNEEFETAKKMISNHIMLTQFDINKTTYLQMDGSKVGLWFTLYQKNEDDVVSIVAMGSTGIKGLQKLYSPMELESLAIQYALSKTKYYTLSCPHLCSSNHMQ